MLASLYDASMAMGEHFRENRPIWPAAAHHEGK